MITQMARTSKCSPHISKHPLHESVRDRAAHSVPVLPRSHAPLDAYVQALLRWRRSTFDSAASECEGTLQRDRADAFHLCQLVHLLDARIAERFPNPVHVLGL